VHREGDTVLDHLVGKREQHGGHYQVEAFRSFEVDDELEIDG
jgi:hypothetical protein